MKCISLVLLLVCLATTSALADPLGVQSGYAISCNNEVIVLSTSGHASLVPEQMPDGNMLYKLCSEDGAVAAACDTTEFDLAEGEHSIIRHVDPFDHLNFGSIRSVMLASVTFVDEPEEEPTKFPWQREGEEETFIYVPVPNEPTVPPIGERGSLAPLTPMVYVPYRPIGDWPVLEW